MTGEQIRNKTIDTVSQRATNIFTMVTVRLSESKNLSRRKLVLIEVAPGEMTSFGRASRVRGDSVAAVFCNGSLLSIRQRGKGGSVSKGEKKA